MRRAVSVGAFAPAKPSSPCAASRGVALPLRDAPPPDEPRSPRGVVSAEPPPPGRSVSAGRPGVGAWLPCA